MASFVRHYKQRLTDTLLYSVSSRDTYKFFDLRQINNDTLTKNGVTVCFDDRNVVIDLMNSDETVETRVTEAAVYTAVKLSDEHIMLSVKTTEHFGKSVYLTTVEANQLVTLLQKEV